MSRRPPLSLLTTTRRGRGIVVGSLLLVGAGLVIGPTGAVAAPPLPAVAVVITSIVNTTQNVAIPTTPGAPVALLKANDQFTLTATLVNAKGGAVAFSSSRDTTLTLTAAGASWVGALYPTAVVPAKGTTASFTGVALESSTGDVTLTVAATAPSDAALQLAPDSTSPFDLLKTITNVVIADGHQASPNGPDTPCQVGDGSTVPQTCAELVAPNGVTGDVVFTTATCVTANCVGNNHLLQVLADVPHATSRTPAGTVIVTCDKTLCGNGGVTSFIVQASLAGGGALAPAPACKKKGLLNSSDAACVDYVSSTKDNAGDVHLFLRIPFDVRAMCC
jgi:hypothetical protein